VRPHRKDLSKGEDVFLVSVDLLFPMFGGWWEGATPKVVESGKDQQPVKRRVVVQRWVQPLAIVSARATIRRA
jgi:hypothetical protein